MMLGPYHHDVRTTLTLDDDLADRVKKEMGRTGKSFKETVNELIRRGLAARKTQQPSQRFEIRARPLGHRPGLNYDKVSELIEQIEGPLSR
jgi:hypothetical protein